jgi:hypothetical protein
MDFLQPKSTHFARSLLHPDEVCQKNHVVQYDFQVQPIRQIPVSVVNHMHMCKSNHSNTVFICPYQNVHERVHWPIWFKHIHNKFVLHSQQKWEIISCTTLFEQTIQECLLIFNWSLLKHLDLMVTIPDLIPWHLNLTHTLPLHHLCTTPLASSLRLTCWL